MLNWARGILGGGNNSWMENQTTEVSDALAEAVDKAVPEEAPVEIPAEIDPTLGEQIDNVVEETRVIPVEVQGVGSGTHDYNGTQHGGGAGGGFAVGTSYIPYDNYLAFLHKGESVLTAVQAQKWRASGAGAGNGGSLNPAQLKQVLGVFTEALSGVSVNMSGQAVGALVAPAVSEAIARQIGR